MPLKIFISTVTKEFHRTAPVYRVKFTSYRDLLALHLRREFKGCQIVVQEELVQGTSDLLGTLDQEIQSCDFEIHIIGDAAGARPRENELEKLRARHPGFLDSYPKLRDDLLDWSQVSYTQWEAYLAFHHDNKRLIFKAEPSAPRNPEYLVDPEEKETQVAHLARIRAVGEHYQGFYSQADLVIKTIRSVFTSQSFTISTSVDAKQLGCRVEAVLRKKSKEPPESYDPSRIDQYFQAVEEVAKEFGLDRSTAIRILDEYSRLRKETLESESAIETHRELAELALANGEYQESIIQARNWIDKATQILSLRPEKFESTRELLLDGYQYWHDAAVLSGNLEEAIIAVKDGLRHIDRDLEPIAWADFMEPLFRSAMASRDYELADDVLDSIIDIREEHQAGSLELAKALYDWSELLRDKGNHQGASEVATRILSSEFSKARKDNSLFGLNVQNLLGMSLMKLTRFVQAENVMLRAIRDGEYFLGAEHPDMHIALNNLACLLSKTNRSEGAKRLYYQALDIAESNRGKDHPSVAAILGNLAGLLSDENNLAEAEFMFRRALKINEESYGDDHPEVVICLNNLAVLLNTNGRPSEAEPLFRRAIQIIEACFGTEHPIVATTLNNLAGMLWKIKCLDQAEALLNRSLRIIENNYGPDHPEVAVLLDNKATLLFETDREREAEPLFRRAIKIFEDSYGQNHPDFAICLSNLASCLFKNKKLTEAEQLFRQALKIRESNLSPNHPDIARSLDSLAELLGRIKLESEAERLYQRSFKIWEAALGPEHPGVAVSLSVLANLLSDTNRRADAERLLKRALMILIAYEKSTGEAHPYYEECKEEYSTLLKNLGYTPERIATTLNDIEAEAISKASSNQKSQAE